MNTTTLLAILAVVLIAVLTLTAAVYSYHRLATDRQLALSRFEHVAVLLARRQEIAGEMLETVRGRLAERQSPDDVADIEAALTVTRRALARAGGLPTASLAAEISAAESGLREAIDGFAERAQASGVMAGDVGFENRMREWQRVNDALPSVLAAYNEMVRIYQNRRDRPWVRPFLGVFDHPAAGRLRLSGLNV
jgi:hypothetical protein